MDEAETPEPHHDKLKPEDSAESSASGASEGEHVEPPLSPEEVVARAKDSFDAVTRANPLLNNARFADEVAKAFNQNDALIKANLAVSDQVRKVLEGSEFAKSLTQTNAKLAKQISDMSSYSRFGEDFAKQLRRSTVIPSIHATVAKQAREVAAAQADAGEKLRRKALEASAGSMRQFPVSEPLTNIVPKRVERRIAEGVERLCDLTAEYQEDQRTSNEIIQTELGTQTQAQADAEGREKLIVGVSLAAVLISLVFGVVGIVMSARQPGPASAEDIARAVAKESASARSAEAEQTRAMKIMGDQLIRLRTQPPPKTVSRTPAVQLAKAAASR